jgi:protein phosphatase
MQRKPLADDHAKLVRRMDRAIKEASYAIFQASRRNMKQRGMGCTVTAAGMVDGRIFLGQVGDSRAYILRADEIFLVTKDQSLLNQLLEAGQITPEEAPDFEYQNVILQAAGTQDKVDPEFSFVDLRQGDMLLVCSDGLHGMVGDDVIAYTMLNAPTLEDGCKELINQANTNGGHDNVTAILARFSGDGLHEADGERILYQTVTVEENDVDMLEGKAPATSADGAAAAAWADDEDFPEVTVD